MKAFLVALFACCALVSEAPALGLPKLKKPKIDAATQEDAQKGAQAAENLMPLPVYETLSQAQLNHSDSLDYVKKLSAWNAKPFFFDRYQVVQVVVPNEQLKSYEANFVTVGRVSRDECAKRIPGLLAGLPAAVKGVAAARCLSSSDSLAPADPDGDRQDLVHFGEYKNEVNMMMASMSQLPELSKELKPATDNVFAKGRKYDFNKDGYVVSSQFLNTSFSEDVPVAKKDEAKPEFNPMAPFNATVKGGVVCQLKYLVEEASSYDTAATVGMVGGIDETGLPKCYRLKAGGSVDAQKFSQTGGVTTWRVSFMMEHDGAHYQYEATTLPENVEFAASKKASKSAFK